MSPLALTDFCVAPGKSALTVAPAGDEKPQPYAPARRPASRPPLRPRPPPPARPGRF